MNRPVVALDLDDTLLQNRSMLRGIWQHIATVFSDAAVDPDMAYDSSQTYYAETAPGMFTYDFDKHLGYYGIDPAAAYESVGASDLSDGRYEIDNLSQFISDVQRVADLLIVTYGYDGFQRLKASLCPSLDGIEIITTLGGKAQLLRENKAVRYMVDDRPVPDLPDTIKFVMVSLVGKSVEPNLPWPVFTNLKEVGEYVYDQMH